MEKNYVVLDANTNEASNTRTVSLGSPSTGPGNMPMPGMPFMSWAIVGATDAEIAGTKIGKTITLTMSFPAQVVEAAPAPAPTS
jgi:hypothetical protein